MIDGGKKTSKTKCVYTTHTKNSVNKKRMQNSATAIEVPQEIKIKLLYGPSSPLLHIYI